MLLQYLARLRTGLVSAGRWYRGLVARHFMQPLRESGLLRSFWLIGLAGGLFMVFATPPMGGFDEAAHFQAAIYYSGHTGEAPPREGAIKMVYIDAGSVDATIGANYARSQGTPNALLYSSFWNQPYDTGENRPADLSAASVYSPLAYAPAIAGAFIARAADAPLLVVLWAARIACLLAYLLLAYVALRYLPAGKWALFVVALLPMTLFQAATISTDGLLNGVVFLFVALLAHIYTAPPATALQRRRWLLAIGTVGIVLAFCKPTYAPLLLAVLAIPARHFAGRGQRIGSLIGLLVPAIVCAVLWNLHVREAALAIGELYRQGYDIAPDRQLALLIEHPWRFVTVLGGNLQAQGFGYLSQFVGVFDPMLTRMPAWITIPAALMIPLALLLSPAGRFVSLSRKLLLGGVAMATVLVICLSFYLTYTPVARSIIDGIQGRYFMPVAALLIPVFASKKTHLPVARPGVFIVPAVCAILVAGCHQLWVMNW
jgi:uncharacterized membrane protein